MRSMPATIHLRPEDLWQAFSLFSWPLLLRLPILLFKGFRLSRRAKQQPTWLPKSIFQFNSQEI
jgi:hypothetical protein